MVNNHFKYVLLLLLINAQIHLSAQDSEYDFSAYNKRNIKVESPNAIGMMQYGNNPVDLSRGTISHQIALYHYEDADFKLPINISYSNNGYKVNQLSGPLGLGWRLNAGGCITRQVHGQVDEFMDKDLGIGFYFLHKLGYDKIDYLDQVKNAQDKKDYRPYLIVAPDLKKYDPEPDEFHFSFMGYEGNFIFGYKNKIHIYDTNISSTNIKIKGDIYTFSISVGDGYEYLFTPKEYMATIDHKEITVSWMLTKVTAPNGRTIFFDYDTYSAHNAGAHHALAEYMLPTGDIVYNDAGDCGREVSTGPNHDEWVKRPQISMCYLRRIYIADGIEIKFDYINQDDIDGGSPLKHSLRLLKEINTFTPSETIPLKKCSFDFLFYQNDFFLSALQVQGEGKYTMEYNKACGMPYMGTHSSDHWGYYNGKPNSTLADFIPKTVYDNLENETIVSTQRDPDASFARVGMLEKITYPTGGYTRYEYEANTYSRLVDRRNEGQTNMIFDMLVNKESDCETGGLRIKRIVDYTQDGKFNERTFSYQESNGKSSGLLLYMPRYKFLYSGDLEMTCPYRSTRKESTVNVLNNVPPIGTHIMYRRATETKSDHSTVEYIFDTYENNRDITSPLERTENEIKYYPSADHYIKGNRDYVNYLFRDVPTNYSRLGHLLYKRYYKYENAPDWVREERYDYSYTYPIADTIRLYKYAMDATYPYIKYVTNTVLLEKYVFDNYNNTETKYEYNSKDQLIQKTERIKNDRHLIHRYTYVNDLKNLSEAEAYMKSINMIHAPIEHSVSLKNGASESIIEKQMIEYKKLGNFVKPYRQKVLINGAYEVREEYLYDRIGNVSQTKFKDGTVVCQLWGYGGRYCVATILNADLSTINNLPSMRNVSFPISGALTATQVDELYNLPNTQVEIYEYKPNVGMTLRKDSRKLDTIFEYDADNRLQRTINSDMMEEYDIHIISDPHTKK